MSVHHAVTGQTASPSIDFSIVEEAAAWLVRLEEGDLHPEEQQRLQAWRARSPDHERAWHAAVELKGLMSTVPGDVGRTVLGRKRMHRRDVLKSLVALLVAAPVGWGTYRQLPADSWRADYRTGIGESKSLQLPDGSRLRLNTDSAVDLAFDHDTRRLILQRGEVLVETAKDPGLKARPFIVEAAQGSIRALGTRFIVRGGRDEDASETRVVVLEHAVAIQPAALAVETRIEAGEAAYFSQFRLPQPDRADASASAWLRGQIIADRLRLGDLVRELSRYRHGVLRCDPEVADLRISGVFQTQDTDRVLGIIAETLPIEVRRRTPYWVTLTAKY